MAKYPRTSWPVDFPDVIVHRALKVRNNHRDYAAAKAGEPFAAQKLVRDLLSDEGVSRIRILLAGSRALMVPVAAVEVTGFNAIPDAMAQELAGRLGVAMAPYDFRQSNYFAHTKADGWHRLVAPAEFTGTITPGTEFFLIDDHVGFGGTLANLRGYIEVNGGHVLGMTTLTETGGARKIAIRQETLRVLKEKHGRDLEYFWNALFSHGIDCLNDIEAGYLSRVESVAAIQARMAQAAAAARGRAVSAVRFPEP